MKYVLLGAFLVLTIVSLVGVWTKEEARYDVPVLYWVTDSNPARLEQIRGFQSWLERNGHPKFILHTDTANSEPAKKVIQGVSGVLADVVDLQGNDMPYFVELGLFEDVTEHAKRLDFDPSHTYGSVMPQLVRDGRQYRYPCNVTTSALWVNRATFEKFNQPLPPETWTFDEFERLGKAYVAAANPPGQRATHFYADQIDSSLLRRSLGLDTFNETLTRCALDDPRQVEILRRLHQWTYVDKILPTAAEAESFATDAGYGSAGPQLFNSGRYAMLWSGRHMLIQFREFGALDLAVVGAPHGGFRNASVETRASGVYAGGEHRELAVLFLAYLASPEYNQHLIDDADGLPPDPAAARSESFLRPPAYPNEWGTHGAFAEQAEKIGIPSSLSPFVLPSVVTRLERNALDALMRSGRLTPEQAAASAARTINDEIARTVSEDSKLRERYDTALARQAEIDARRAAGQKVPLDWIANPFHRVYYQKMGWAE